MSDPERVQTSDRLVRAIEEALEALPKDLLSHVWTEGPERLGISVAPEPQWDKQTDAKVVWNWVRERVRWVLEVLGQNPEIAGHWAQSLPKPWLVDLDIGKADLSRVPPKARREYEKVAKARNAICASVPPKGAASVKLPPFPVEVQQAEDEAYAKLDAAGADWDAAFFDNPAVWLWAIWDQWLRTRMKAVPPGKPDWPGAAALANPRGVNRFLFQIRLRIALWITTRPGEAANYFKRALEELREGLVEDAPAGPAARAQETEANAAVVQGTKSFQSESGTDWRDVQRRLFQMHDQGEPYTSLRVLAVPLGCSPSTVRKAIEKSSALSRWKATHQEDKGPPRATGLSRVVTDNARQSREPDPAEAAEQAEAEDILSRLIQEVDPPVRAQLNEISRDEVRKMTPDGVREMVEMLEDDRDAGPRLLGRQP